MPVFKRGQASCACTSWRASRRHLLWCRPRGPAGRSCSAHLSADGWKPLWNPQNLYVYEDAKFERLAVGYLFSICKAHAYVDGNKRTACAAMRAFLIINGVELDYDELEAIRFVEQVAAGELTFEDSCMD